MFKRLARLFKPKPKLINLPKLGFTTCFYFPGLTDEQLAEMQQILDERRAVEKRMEEERNKK